MILNRKAKYESHFKIDELTIKNKSGKEVKREVLVRKNAVAALVYDTNLEKYIFVSQFRPGVGDFITEIVAGTLDKQEEDPREAIIREIKEEIGYKVDNIQFLSKGYASPGGSNEEITIYYAEVSEKIGDGGGLINEDEEIEIIQMSLEELKHTDFKDLKTILSVQWKLMNR
jgi:ADP-ribose pyrophosphatase